MTDRLLLFGVSYLNSELCLGFYAFDISDLVPAGLHKREVELCCSFVAIADWELPKMTYGDAQSADCSSLNRNGRRRERRAWQKRNKNWSLFSVKYRWWMTCSIFTCNLVKLGQRILAANFLSLYLIPYCMETDIFVFMRLKCIIYDAMCGFGKINDFYSDSAFIYLDIII